MFRVQPIAQTGDTGSDLVKLHPLLAAVCVEGIVSSVDGMEGVRVKADVLAGTAR